MSFESFKSAAAREAAKSATTKARREELSKAVKESSDKNRHFFIAWILFVSYIAIIVLSTSDIQLLKTNGAVVLPVVGVQVPLLGFYFLAPALIFAVQFNLLQNLDSHAYRLKLWADAYEGSPPREELSPFLFDYAALERGGAFENMLRVCSDFLFFWLGPISLAVILVRFSDFQDWLFTSWHMLLLCLSILVVVRARAAQPKFHARYSLMWRMGGGVMSGLCVTMVTLNFVIVLGISLDIGLVHRWMRSTTLTATYLPLYELVAPRLSAPPGTLFLPSDGDFELRAKLEGSAMSEWWADKGAGVVWRGRSLAHSSLPQADLRRADLRGVRFQAADLSGAILEHAQLARANLSGADLEDAILDGASLDSAALVGTNLAGVRAVGVSLNFTDLRASDLRSARLVGAHSMESNFEGAKLVGTKFVAATLSNIDLSATRMYQPDFSGAILTNVKIGDALKEPRDQEAAAARPGSPLRFVFDKSYAYSDVSPIYSLRSAPPSWPTGIYRRESFTLSDIWGAARDGEKAVTQDDLVAEVARTPLKDASASLALRLCQMSTASEDARSAADHFRYAIGSIYRPDIEAIQSLFEQLSVLEECEQHRNGICRAAHLRVQRGVLKLIPGACREPNTLLPAPKR